MSWWANKEANGVFIDPHATRYKRNGQLHRADGPAIIFNDADGYALWVWHGHTFDPEVYREHWSDEKKAWWMRARLNSP